MCRLVKCDQFALMLWTTPSSWPHSSKSNKLLLLLQLKLLMLRLLLNKYKYFLLFSRHFHFMGLNLLQFHSKTSYLYNLPAGWPNHFVDTFSYWWRFMQCVSLSLSMTLSALCSHDAGAKLNVSQSSHSDDCTDITTSM